MKRIASSVIAALLLAGGVLVYQYKVKNNRPPSFSEGGEFANADSLKVPGKNGVPFPYGDASGVTTTTAAIAGAAPTVTSTAPTTSAPTTIATTVAGATVPPFPRSGAYTFAVDGSEGASGFGNRGLPKTAGLVVHDNPGKPDQRVFDLRLSNQHEEREVLSYGTDGIAFAFEGGSITFGPMTQTSEGFYNPPMIQVPWPLAVGTKVTKASPVTDSKGNKPRTEKWTTTVVGKETLNVLGQPHETWVVEIQRNTTPGTTEQVDRYRKYWYDPALGTWVKWTEKFTAAREGFVTFSYKANYTATLTSFVPA